MELDSILDVFVPYTPRKKNPTHLESGQTPETWRLNGGGGANSELSIYQSYHQN